VAVFVDVVVVANDLAVEHVSGITEMVLKRLDVNARADVVDYDVAYALGGCLV
jgi:hypothetical protein